MDLGSARHTAWFTATFARAALGQYVREAGELQFCEVGEPTAEDVAKFAAWTHASLLRVLKRHGQGLVGSQLPFEEYLQYLDAN